MCRRCSSLSNSGLPLGFPSLVSLKKLKASEDPQRILARSQKRLRTSRMKSHNKLKSIGLFSATWNIGSHLEYVQLSRTSKTKASFCCHRWRFSTPNERSINIVYQTIRRMTGLINSAERPFDCHRTQCPMHRTRSPLTGAHKNYIKAEVVYSPGCMQKTVQIAGKFQVATRSADSVHSADWSQDSRIVR